MLEQFKTCSSMAEDPDPTAPPVPKAWDFPFNPVSGESKRCPARGLGLMKASKHRAPNYGGVALLPQSGVSLPRAPGSAQSGPEAEEEHGGQSLPRGGQMGRLAPAPVL